MPFQYLRDPLFRSCLFLYFVNRWGIKPLVTEGFAHNHFNDLICIPFWVPPMLWVMRRLRLRDHDRPPEGYELLISWLVWSYVFEVQAPQLAAFQGLVYADPLDIVWYLVGTLLAFLFWNWWYQPRS